MRRNCTLVVMLILSNTLEQMALRCTCQCTVDKLSEKFSDEEMDEVFSKEPDEIMEQTAFATEDCEK